MPNYLYHTPPLLLNLAVSKFGGAHPSLALLSPFPHTSGAPWITHQQAPHS